MNIEVGIWKLEYGQITNRETNEVRRVEVIPHSSLISHMDYAVCLRKTAIAFETGKWPLTRRVCRYCRQEYFEQA